MHPINEFGTKEQKEKYLPALASGELIGCFVRDCGFYLAFLSPVHGGRVSQNRTTAQIRQVWRRLPRKLTGAISSMEAKHGLPTPHLRECPWRVSICARLIMCSDVFIVWAKCKWDGKIRGFILEKVDGKYLPTLTKSF